METYLYMNNFFLNINNFIVLLPVEINMSAHDFHAFFDRLNYTLLSIVLISLTCYTDPLDKPKKGDKRNTKGGVREDSTWIKVR